MTSLICDTSGHKINLKREAWIFGSTIELKLGCGTIPGIDVESVYFLLVSYPQLLIKDQIAGMLEDTKMSVESGFQHKRDAPSKAVVDHANDNDAQSVSSPPKKKRATPRKADEEKRLKRFRQKPPGSYLEKLHRATTQRSVMSPSV